MSGCMLLSIIIKTMTVIIMNHFNNNNRYFNDHGTWPNSSLAYIHQSNSGYESVCISVNFDINFTLFHNCSFHFSMTSSIMPKYFTVRVWYYFTIYSKGCTILFHFWELLYWVALKILMWQDSLNVTFKLVLILQYDFFKTNSQLFPFGTYILFIIFKW